MTQWIPPCCEHTPSHTEALINPKCPTLPARRWLCPGYGLLWPPLFRGRSMMATVTYLSGVKTEAHSNGLCFLCLILHADIVELYGYWSIIEMSMNTQLFTLTQLLFNFYSLLLCTFRSNDCTLYYTVKKGQMTDSKGCQTKNVNLRQKNVTLSTHSALYYFSELPNSHHLYSYFSSGLRHCFPGFAFTQFTFVRCTYVPLLTVTCSEAQHA